ncbi:MAG: hypothetical protein KTR14_05120 [Vampirovibrio sp.]|nr:hypothetical protein [Vampirovibrio sp.]
MNYKQMVPAVAVTLGLSAGLAAQSMANPLTTDGLNLFQMNEVSNQGALLAEGDHKCGKGACGGEHDEDDKGEHKCGKDHCGDDKDHGDSDHKCGKDSCGGDKDH